MGKTLPFRYESRGRDAAEGGFNAVHMAAWIACVLTLALVLQGYTPARAESSNGCLTGGWITEAAAFVTEETGIPAPEVCVRLARPEHLKALILSAAFGTAHDQIVAAVYLPATREILLADDLDPATLLARSYLVHELVHAQQFASRARGHASCLGVLEADAYGTQALYLRTRGLREEAFLLQVLGMLQGACGYSD